VSFIHLLLIFGVLVVFYQLMALKDPFKGLNISDVTPKIIHGEYPPLGGKYSLDLKHLVGKMLFVDANKRISIEHICNFCQNIIFMQNSKNKLSNKEFNLLGLKNLIGQWIEIYLQAAMKYYKMSADRENSNRMLPDGYGLKNGYLGYKDLYEA
jgi:serine/threonine protein kinase